MSQQTQNAFYLNYLISKQAWNLKDGCYDELFNSPKPPTKKMYKVKSRMMTSEEWKKAKQQMKLLNIK